VQRGDVRVQVNGDERQISWEGRYVMVGVVVPGDVATIAFPISERTDTVHIQKTRYALVRRGSEVVAIDPPGRFAPLYLRDHYRQDATRWRRAERFVCDKPVHW
jgi:hypothetical protein